MNLLLSMLPDPETQSWSILLEDFTAVSGPVVSVWEVGAARAVCDVPVLQPPLEDTTHHLWSTIRGDVFQRQVVQECDHMD